MKTKKQITIMLAIMLALPLVLAMYGGESKVIEFSFETDNCTIVPDISEGINFTFNGNQVLVEPEINFIGSYNITCYDWKTRTEETHEEEESGGDGGYYTYPWRDKVNVTEFNETKLEEDLDIEGNLTIEGDLILEPRSNKSKVLGAIALAIILGIILDYT